MLPISAGPSRRTGRAEAAAESVALPGSDRFGHLTGPTARFDRGIGME